MQEAILEEQLGPEFRIEPRVQPGEPRLVHRKFATETMEAGGWQTELRRVERLPVRSLSECVADPEDPRGIRMFLHHSHADPDVVIALVSRANADRATNSVAAISAVHQIDEVLAAGKTSRAGTRWWGVPLSV